MTDNDPFTVTTRVPEKPATTTVVTNETLAKPGNEPSEKLKTDTKVETKPADQTATESTDDEVTETPEETDTEESSDEEVETKPENDDPKPKKKSGFQRRVEKLNARISAAEQEREYWKNEAIKNQRVPTKEEAPLKVQATGKPDKDKFGTHDEYIEALAEWKADQKFKAIEEERKQNSAKEAAQKRLNDHFSRVETFKEDHEDFDETWSSLKVPLTLAMTEAIKESDLGPDLMYALAKDPKECARIAKLTPLAAARELGKLEIKVSKSPSDPLVEVKPKTTNVTEQVVTPVKPRGGTNKKSVYDPELSFDEYAKLRDAEERARYAQLRR